jgi:hypothetical protein
MMIPPGPLLPPILTPILPLTAPAANGSIARGEHRRRRGSEPRRPDSPFVMAVLVTMVYCLNCPSMLVVTAGSAPSGVTFSRECINREVRRLSTVIFLHPD